MFAFLLTLGAGLSTGIGSLVGVLSRRFRPSVLTLALSFSAGVMLFVSFVEIFPKARQALTPALGTSLAYLVAVVAFFAGMLADLKIDPASVPWVPSNGAAPGDSASVAVPPAGPAPAKPCCRHAS